MGLFDNRKTNKSATGGSQVIASHLIARLPEVGQATFGASPTFVDVSEFYLPSFLAAGMPTEQPGWGAFVDRFVAELNQASIRQGEWASAGAFHVAKDFVKSEDWAREDLVELMDRALVFLVSSDTHASYIPMFAQQRWREIEREAN